MLQAGKLRHRVTYERNEQIQNPESGSLVDNWVALGGGAWVSIEPLSGRALIAAQSADSDVTTNIIARYRAGVTDDMRIVHRGRAYYITAVLADKGSGREYMTMPCTDKPHG